MLLKLCRKQGAHDIDLDYASQLEVAKRSRQDPQAKTPEAPGTFNSCIKNFFQFKIHLSSYFIDSIIFTCFCLINFKLTFII